VTVAAPPETIATAHLVLRRPRPADAPNIYAYGSDPEVTRWMDWPTHTAESDAAAYVEEAGRRWASGEEFAWVITLPPDDRAIGGVGARVRGHAVDLGWVLARAQWRNGYAPEAARAVLEWASTLDDVHRIWATCDVDNGASARVMEKIGMTREGLLRRWAAKPNLPGPPRDAWVYSWIRDVR
jgi:RimJ/RimL family protein N-acetyltransferase